MKDLIKKIKISQLYIIKKDAIDWWNGLAIQNLEDMRDSWVGYVCKYYPNETNIYHLTDDEILNIWKQEQEIK